MGLFNLASDLKEKMVFVINIILSRRSYFYGTLLIVLIFLGFIIYLIARPKIPEIPSPPGGSLSEDLVTYWALNEKGGQITYDATGQHHNGRLGQSNAPDLADPKRHEKGKIGRALKFDGKDDYVIVENHPDFQIQKEITLEGWFKVLGQSNPSPKPIWLPDFQYRRQIILKNRSSKSYLRNFQLLVTIDTSSLIRQGKMQSNCQDIRFTDWDETTLLPYWLESGCNTEKTKIWVKVPYLGAGEIKHLYFYYDNPEVKSESNYYKIMEAPPLKWWEYPTEERMWEHQKIQAIAVDPSDTIFAVGSQRYQRDIRWFKEEVNAYGEKRNEEVANPSSGPDEINDVAIGPRGLIVFGGYDSAPGNFQWQARIGRWRDILTFNFSPGSDEIEAVAVDSENNIFLAGYDSVPGDNRWHLIKLNDNEEILWEYTLNPSDQADIITDVKVDSRNNVIIAGFEKSLGNDRWRIEKLSPEGELLYSYRFNISQGADVLNAIAVDSKDNVIAVGYDFYPGNAQWRIVKINPEGNKLWQWHFNPSPGFDELKGVAIDSNDNIIVAGNDSAPGNLQWDVLKFSPEGEKIWQWRYNPSNENDEIKDIKVDSENNIILAGSDYSFRTNPGWRIIKISEKKLLSPSPSTTIGLEVISPSLPKNVILAKPGSYQISANKSQLTGVINQKNFISTPIKAGVWNHFVLTYDGALLRLYLNGKLVNSKALTEKIESDLNNLLIGYNFNGLIDELKIYERALSSREVRSLYQIGIR